MQSLNQEFIENFDFHSQIHTATTCIAHCVSSVFAMGKRLASALACCYLEFQEIRILLINNFPPGSLVT